MAGCNSNNIVVAMPIASQQLWQKPREGGRGNNDTRDDSAPQMMHMLQGILYAPIRTQAKQH